jgi:hypothetical protein
MKNAVSGMWPRVLLVWTDVSEECIASIFSLQPPAHADSSLPDFSTLKMEAIRSSETSVYTRSTRRHIPENDIPLIPLLAICFMLILFGLLLNPEDRGDTFFLNTRLLSTDYMALYPSVWNSSQAPRLYFCSHQETITSLIIRILLL